MLQETAAARLAEVAIAACRRIPPRRLRTASRGRRPVAQARQTAMYLAHVAFGITLTRVGTCFGRDRTTVRHACALIEDSRDDPVREFSLGALEAALLALRSSQLRETMEDRR
ncbi:MAG: chromosomal replication initiator DnaA [Bosea sp. (in: a-proteobacteria)]|nr:MAG: chromosomal replication initiator DnaA [Bosea sp. (in: a-proteobacteria)]